MTDVEIVAQTLYERSDHKFWGLIIDPDIKTWWRTLAAAALAEMTPLIEARVREECIAAVRSVPHGTGYGVANCEAAIRKGTSNE